MIKYQMLKKDWHRSKSKAYHAKKKKAYSIVHKGEGQYVTMYPKPKDGAIGHCFFHGTFLRKYVNEKVFNLYVGDYEQLMDVETVDGVMTIRCTIVPFSFNCDIAKLENGDKIDFNAWLSEELNWTLDSISKRD